MGEGPWWSQCRFSHDISPYLRKGRRPTLILRTQLSVRVHAIIGESGLLLPPGWPGAGRSLPPKHRVGLASTFGFLGWRQGTMQPRAAATL